MLQLKLTNSLCSFLLLFLKIVFLAMLGMFLQLWSRGYSLAAVLHRLLIVTASLTVQHGLHLGLGFNSGSTWGSVVVAHGLSCSQERVIFPDTNQTGVPSSGRWILNHCTTREVHQFVKLAWEFFSLGRLLGSNL